MSGLREFMAVWIKHDLLVHGKKEDLVKRVKTHFQDLYLRQEHLFFSYQRWFNAAFMALYVASHVL